MNSQNNKVIEEGDLIFDFSNSLNCIKFDDKDHNQLSHANMCGVDIIVELKDKYYFIEVKDPSTPNSNIGIDDKDACYQYLYGDDNALINSCGQVKKNKDKHLVNCLVMKYRNTLLYRWAQNKIDKPIHFLSLITLEKEELEPFNDLLNQKLPLISAKNWAKPIVDGCDVLSYQDWKKHYSEFPIKRKSEGTSSTASTAS